MSQLPTGTRLGPYEVGEVLGRGGMSVVYKGYDPTLDRVVALKVLPPDFLHDATFSERLRREAQLWSRLDHPAIVPVYYSGIQDDHPFLAMKYIAGGPVSALIREGPVPVARTVVILKSVGSALDYAHDAGIVHRDVKPANVLLGEEGSGYLTDFGIARALAESRGATGGSGIVGTPGYMAPEQARSPRPEPRSDVYSLGCLAYEMLTGRPPFQGETPMDVMLQHVLEDPKPLRDWVPTLPGGVESVVRKAMAKDPADRWPRAGQFIRALEAASGTPGLDTVSLTGLAPVRERPSPSPARLLAVAGLSALVGFAGVALARSRIAAPAQDAAGVPAYSQRSILEASRRLMDQGAYPEALGVWDLSVRLFPAWQEAKRHRDRVLSAWEAEKSLRTWTPAPGPAPSAAPAPPSPVDGAGGRR